MLILLSPAKKLNFQKNAINFTSSVPFFLKEAKLLAETASHLNPSELSKLMKISPKLANLNYDRFQKFSENPDPEKLKQAAFTFNGDTYLGLDSDSVDQVNHEFMQNHLRILSGLYGVLKPFDLIQPYRLEMGSRLSNSQGENLYAYWGEKISDSLKNELEDHKHKILINLASEEYFKVLKNGVSASQVVTPKFYEKRNGQIKIISFLAKKARGLMARFIIDNNITNPKELENFQSSGYSFQKSKSDSENLIFLREQ